MSALSTSLVSLHSFAESGRHANKSPSNASDKKPSIIYFLALVYSFLSMGFGTGLLGPTLLKFGEQIQVPLSQVIYILFTRSFGFLLGTLVAGVLIDRFPLLGQTFLACTVFIMSATTIVIPFMYHLIPMIIAHLMWSLTGGIVDNLAQILTIRYYEKTNVNPYLQALHGAFAVGGLLSPLIMALFLRESSPTNQWHYAYWIIGCLHIPNIIWISIYAIRDELCLKKTKQINLDNNEVVAENDKLQTVVTVDNSTKSSETFLFITLIMLFIFLYVGAESAFVSYIHTYATLHLNFRKDTAAYLNSIFWAAFAISRICGVPLSINFSSVQMLISDLIGCVISIALLMILNKSSLIFWLGSILLGLSVGSIYPSAIAYVEKRITVTGRRMSLLAIGGSAGDAVIPLLIGYIINPKLLGPIGFMYVSFIVIVLASLLYGFIIFYVRFQLKTNQNTVVRIDLKTNK